MNLRRGDIFWGDFGFKCRPYIVVSCDARNATSNSAIVIPITTKQYSRDVSDTCSDMLRKHMFFSMHG